MRWLIPNNLWDNFRLDRIIYITAHFNPSGMMYQWVWREFYDRYYKTYRWPTVIDRRAMLDNPDEWV